MRRRGKPAESLNMLSQIHDEIRETLQKQQDAAVMKLLEQCQAIALEVGTRAEKGKGKHCEITAIMEDYCELVYEVNEQIWHGEYVNPGKVYKYLNKSLGLMRESMSKDKEKEG